jgi:hypothetical protein
LRDPGSIKGPSHPILGKGDSGSPKEEIFTKAIINEGYGLCGLQLPLARITMLPGNGII